MIVCRIRYILDPHRFVGSFALALIACESLAAYDTYRAKLAADREARENRTRAERTQCILVEDRSFLRAA